MRLVEGVVHVADGAADADAPAAPDGVPAFDGVDALVTRLGEVGEAHGVTVQAFDAGLVVDRQHLERAVELADRERARGEGIARNRAVEILLYAAGRRQIDRALGLGVGPDATPAVVLVDAPPEAASRGDDDRGNEQTDGAAAATDAGETAAADAVRDLLEPAETLGDYDDGRVREFFDVDEAELAATTADLPALVRERVALLVVNR